MTTLHQRPLGQEKKNVRKRIGTRILACAVAAALLAACGGGGGSSPVPASSHNSAQSVKVTVKVPGKKGALLKNGKRVPAYISRNTLGMGVDWVSHTIGFADKKPNASPAFGVALDPVTNAGICNDPNSGLPGDDGSFTCSFYVPGVPVGYQDIKLTMWDQDPATCPTTTSGSIYGSGCSFATAHALSSDVETNQVILENQNNTWNYTLLPIVDSVALDVTTTPSTLVNGTPLIAANGNVNVVVKDAAGNVIVGGDNFVDQNGNQLTIDIASASSHVTLGTTSFSNSDSASYLSSTLAYDGADMTASNLADLISVSLSPNTASVGGGVANFNLQFAKSNTGLIVPGVPKVGFSTATIAAPNAIAAGPAGDNHVYVVNGSNQIQSISTMTGVAGTGFAVTGATIGDLVLGADNDLWFLDTATNKVGKFNPLTSGATIDPSSAETSAAAPATVTHIVSAGDGKIYLGGTNGEIYNVSPQTMQYSGEIQYAMQSISIGAMAAGFVVSAGGGVYHPGVCATSGSNTGCFDVLNPGTPNHSGANSTGFGWNGAIGGNSLAIGPDHLLYIGQGGQVEARRLNCTVGGVGACLDPLYSYPASGNVTALTAGHDGTIWFVETGAANGNLIGHIQPGNGAQGVMNEFGAQIFGSLVPTHTVTPYSIALGADNNLWFTDSSANSTVNQVVP